MGSYLFVIVFLSPSLHNVLGQTCDESCVLPKCSCARFDFPMDTKDIPQMVYFAFDDALNIVTTRYYDQIFTRSRTNPNKCMMPMTLFISHKYTDYSLVKNNYDKGHEIAVHSVTHSNIITNKKLETEAKEQKENIVDAGIPREDIIGWRSPFLQTAGEKQPLILKQLNYSYDISLTYRIDSLSEPKPWPFTLHNGWPYSCEIPPCPKNVQVNGFWEVPITNVMNKYACTYVDGCYRRPNNADEAYQFLMSNFMSYYMSNKAPFGLHLHAAWFAYPQNLQGTIKFLNRLMEYDDVYVVTVKQMLAWIKQPTPLSRIHELMEWHCEESLQNLVLNTTTTTTSSTTSIKEERTTSSTVQTTLQTPTIPISTSVIIKTTQTHIICATTSKPTEFRTMPTVPDMKSTTETLSKTNSTSLSTSTRDQSTTTPSTSTTPTMSTTEIVLQGSCKATCILPECSCARFEFPMNTKDMPQMVYFAFDDAFNSVVTRYFDQIFTRSRTNPNKCMMPMTLFISHKYTDYSLVKNYYDKGHEIAVHSLTHSNIITNKQLETEAKEQKENIVNAGIPREDIIGWRSPFLQTAGEKQPSILKQLNYSYDISLTYRIDSLSEPKPWPFTLHNGWPYSCAIPPCPNNVQVNGFWEVPITNVMNKYACTYVDGCYRRPNNADEAYQFLMSNFISYYTTNKAPFGLHLHAAWFAYPQNLKGTVKFLNKLMEYDDVYVVTVKQMLAWMKQPTPLSRINELMEWQCEMSRP